MLRRVRRMLLSLAGLTIVIACIGIARSHTHPERSRIEGFSRWKSVLHGPGYLWKYKYKHRLAGQGLDAYFEDQQGRLDSLEHMAGPDTLLQLAFVGDLMWIRSNWDDFLDTGVRQVLEGYDMIFGNLETPVDTLSRIPQLLPDYPAYNSAPGLITSFYSEKKQKNLLSVLSLANNHCFDRGMAGLLRTQHFLQKQGIRHSGLRSPWCEEKPYLRMEEKGISIGYYAATWGVNNPAEMGESGYQVNIIHGLAPLDPSNIDLSYLSSVLYKMEEDGIDIKVISMHWGYEYETCPDPEIMQLAHSLAEAGADLILGSHPHVIQPPEVYFSREPNGKRRKTLILYSLGNFTTAMYTPACRTGAIYSVCLSRDPETGTVAWHSPSSRYVYNAESDPLTGRRKLLMLEDYLSRPNTKHPLQSHRLIRELRIHDKRLAEICSGFE